MRVQCQCGRFLAKPYPLIGWHNFGDAYLADVRGDCSRCGENVPALPGWWHSWDAWDNHGNLTQWCDGIIAERLAKA